MIEIFLLPLIVADGVYSYNLSDIATWGSVLAASRLNSIARTDVSPRSSAESHHETRSARAMDVPAEYYNMINKPVDFQQSTPESTDNRRYYYTQPEKYWPETSYKVHTPEYNTGYYNQVECKDARSSGVDGLTYITEIIVKIAKILFGTFIIMLLPIVLLKAFVFPLKMFLLAKILLKLLFLWPLLSRIFPGIILPTTSTLAKVAGPTTVEATRDLIDYLQVEYENKNITRNSKFLDLDQLDNNSTFDGSRLRMADAPCNSKLSCFLSKAITSKNLSTKFVTSAAILLGNRQGGLVGFIKYLENKKEFEECAELQCSENDLNFK